MLTFLGIGAQKSGTTWLREHLALHPEISFPAGKELHYWNRADPPLRQEWLDHFDASSTVREGEITPAYALLNLETVHEIHQSQPNLRLFYSLRSPAQRAWSSALMALSRAELEEPEVSDQWFIDHFRSKGSLGRGDYLETIERWLRVFSREQLKLVYFEDIEQRPREVLGNLACHLGVDAACFDEISEAELHKPRRAGPAIPLRRSLLPELHTLYAKKVELLEVFLGRDLTAWKEDLCG